MDEFAREYDAILDAYALHGPDAEQWIVNMPRDVLAGFAARLFRLASERRAPRAVEPSCPPHLHETARSRRATHMPAHADSQSMGLSDTVQRSSDGVPLVMPCFAVTDSTSDASSMNGSHTADANQLNGIPHVDESQEYMKMSMGAMAQDECGYDMINEYALLSEMGRGSHATVYMACNLETNKMYAVKKLVGVLLSGANGGNLGSPLSLSSSKKARPLQREIAVMKKVRHRNCVTLYEVIEDFDEQDTYLVMDFMSEGSILELSPSYTCDPMPMERAKDVFLQVLTGLAFLHKSGITHNDVKPDNILVDSDGIVKIADFGMSSVCAAAGGSNLIGTPFYTAPELLRGAVKVPMPASDMWSAGVTLYCMLFGKLPFQKCKSISDFGRYVQDQVIQYPAGATPDSVDLLSKLLDKDPSTRITAAAAKKHAFFFEDSGVWPPCLPLEITDDEVSRSVVKGRRGTTMLTSALLPDTVGSAFTMPASPLINPARSNVRSMRLTNPLQPSRDVWEAEPLNVNAVNVRLSIPTIREPTAS